MAQDRTVLRQTFKHLMFSNAVQMSTVHATLHFVVWHMTRFWMIAFAHVRFIAC